MENMHRDMEKSFERMWQPMDMDMPSFGGSASNNDVKQLGATNPPEGKSSWSRMAMSDSQQ